MCEEKKRLREWAGRIKKSKRNKKRNKEWRRKHKYDREWTVYKNEKIKKETQKEKDK